MSEFAVIGLGRFGRSVCLELMRLGHEVIGVDINARYVNQIADHITHAVIADATQEAALQELNLASCEAAIVAIGEHLEASLLCTLHLKTLGVTDIRVKAVTTEHHRILSHLGVSDIVHPEEDMGVRVAQALNYPMVHDYITLGHNQYVVEVVVPAKIAGRTLADVIPASVNLLLLKQRDQLRSSPGGNIPLNTNDRLILVGDLNTLNEFAKAL